MTRRSERDLSLADAERLGGGLSIHERLRVAIELLRAIADAPPAPAFPRGAGSRLHFARVTLDPSGAVSATGKGDASGAAIVLWEICAGRPLDTEPPPRLHDIVDDMPADVDDLVMGALRPCTPPTGTPPTGTPPTGTSPTGTPPTGTPPTGTPPTTAAELLDALLRAGEGYAAPRQGLWERLAGDAPSSRAAPSTARGPANGAAPASRRAGRTPSVRAPAPVSTRARRSSPPASKRAPPPLPEAPAQAPPPSAKPAPPSIKTSATQPSMKAVVPPRAARPSPSLLLIHAGEEAGPLADALRAAGYPVALHRDAASGLAHAVAENPVCIVCDADLPDADGNAVVRRIREQPTAVADAPFVLLVADADAQRRLARFGEGADVYVTKPIRVAALIRQVDALVDMSSRLREAHQAAPALPRAAEAAALSGDIQQVGIAAVLTILEMERRTGSFVTTGEGARASASPRASLAEIAPAHRLELDLARGCVAGASALGVPARPVEVVRAMMRLSVGRFAFKPRKARYVEAPSLSEILSEAARLEDEAAAGRS